MTTLYEQQPTMGGWIHETYKLLNIFSLMSLIGSPFLIVMSFYMCGNGCCKRKHQHNNHNNNKLLSRELVERKNVTKFHVPLAWLLLSCTFLYFAYSSDTWAVYNGGGRGEFGVFPLRFLQSHNDLFRSVMHNFCRNTREVEEAYPQGGASGYCTSWSKIIWRFNFCGSLLFYCVLFHSLLLLSYLLLRIRRGKHASDLPGERLVYRLHPAYPLVVIAILWLTMYTTYQLYFNGFLWSEHAQPQDAEGEEEGAETELWRLKLGTSFYLLLAAIASSFLARRSIAQAQLITNYIEQFLSLTSSISSSSSPSSSSLSAFTSSLSTALNSNNKRGGGAEEQEMSAAEKKSLL